MKPVERTVVLPAAEVVVHRAAWRQVLRDRTPLTAGAQHIHQAVHDLTDVHSPLVAASLGARDLHLGQRPFLIGQVAGVTQLTAVIPGAVLDSPHRAAPANRGSQDGIITDSQDSTCSWTDTKGKDPKIKENLQEAFQIHPELPADDPRVLAGKKLHGTNPWPSAMPDLKPRMMRYYVQMWDLAQELLRLFAIGLDLPEDIFMKFFHEPMLMLRLLHYPPQNPQEITDHIGTRAHTDSGAFTILAQDDTGGLEVCNVDGEWIGVPPIEGSFVINIGEMMKVWTDGTFAATPHRVINRYGRERYSVPFFVTSDYDAIIEPMMRNPEQNNKAPEFATSLPLDRSSVCGEILSHLYWRIYPAYEGETAAAG